jgi:hypothetical protein
MGTELFSVSCDLWTINKLNDCHWSCITRTETALQNTHVSTWALLVTRSKFREQFTNC